MTDIEIEKLADALVRRLAIRVTEEYKDDLRDTVLDSVDSFKKRLIEGLWMALKNMEDAL